MGKEKEDFRLESWEEDMKDWFLDPVNGQLDEKEFRLEFFESTASFILEVDTEHIQPEAVIIKKEGQRLHIILNLKDRKCKRSVTFPFSLDHHPISYTVGHHSIEIMIFKKQSGSFTQDRYIIDCKNDQDSMS
ncbi:hypothetical protein M1I95_10850 [Rossellomorea marisflavi]|uniref:hypothetical protein n=1 Tax=Rossellomorea marisflavi TaxID=189381 RepID=UPI00279C8F1F|nr:hypothetical protein [Rossellomorea marisflavi]UTE74901.1 hypothetical protein M1I95_10850 [Rossellomorea marisflavi]